MNANLINALVKKGPDKRTFNYKPTPEQKKINLPFLIDQAKDNFNMQKECEYLKLTLTNNIRIAKLSGRPNSEINEIYKKLDLVKDQLNLLKEYYNNWLLPMIKTNSMENKNFLEDIKALFSLAKHTKQPQVIHIFEDYAAAAFESLSITQIRELTELSIMNDLEFTISANNNKILLNFKYISNE